MEEGGVETGGWEERREQLHATVTRRAWASIAYASDHTRLSFLSLLVSSRLPHAPICPKTLSCLYRTLPFRKISLSSLNPTLLTYTRMHGRSSSRASRRTVSLRTPLV